MCFQSYQSESKCLKEELHLKYYTDLRITRLYTFLRREQRTVEDNNVKKWYIQKS